MLEKRHDISHHQSIVKAALETKEAQKQIPSLVYTPMFFLFLIFNSRAQFIVVKVDPRFNKYT